MIFTANQAVSVRTPDDILEFTVLQSFEPFTTSVVFLAQCSSLSPDPLPDRPWTAAAELEAARIREAVARGEQEDTYDENGLYFRTLDDIPVRVPGDLEAHARWAAEWEEVFYRTAAIIHRKERTAYERLQHLQGSTLPRFLGEGTRIPPPGETRAFEPHAIFIEYVDGTTLANTPAHLLTPELYKPLVDAVDSFHTYGISHVDLREENVIFSPPTRMAVINFGNAAYRGELEGETDEEWKGVWQMEGDDVRLRDMLEGKGIHVPFPPQ